MENVYDKFAHYEKPLNDFERARQQISTPFDSYDIDLSIARENEIFNIAGDFLYIDMASTGYATIELNNQHDARKAPFLVRKGFALGATFKQLKISNNAQAGAFIRIMSSTGDRVIPAIGDLIISGSVNTIEDGVSYGASYKSNSIFTANVADTIFTPAANVNGAVIHTAEFYFENNAGILGSMIAKNAAPANVADGDVLIVTIPAAISPNRIMVGRLTRPIKIPAGKGLYLISSATELTTSLKSCNYTLL